MVLDIYRPLCKIIGPYKYSRGGLRVAASNHRNRRRRPGGLVAANSLVRNGWSFDIFEADASAASRDQGGTLDLHPDDGQLALMRAGLLDEFLALARHEDQEQRLRDFATGNILHEDIPKPGEGTRPEIDRSALRELMLSRLDPGLIRWGARIDEVKFDFAGMRKKRRSAPMPPPVMRG